MIRDYLILPVVNHTVSFDLLLLIMTILYIHPCVILEVPNIMLSYLFTNQILFSITVQWLIRATFGGLLLQLEARAYPRLLPFIVIPGTLFFYHRLFGTFRRLNLRRQGTKTITLILPKALQSSQNWSRSHNWDLWNPLFSIENAWLLGYFLYTQFVLVRFGRRQSLWSDSPNTSRRGRHILGFLPRRLESAVDHFLENRLWSCDIFLAIKGLFDDDPLPFDLQFALWRTMIYLLLQLRHLRLKTFDAVRELRD